MTEFSQVFKVVYPDKNCINVDDFNAPNTKILVPCSFGSSSFTLLSIIIDHLKEQFQQHKKFAYSVEVLTVYYNNEQLKHFKKNISNVKKLYSLNHSDNKELKDNVQFKLLNMNEYFDDNSDIIIRLTDDYHDYICQNNSDHRTKDLSHFLASADFNGKNASSKEDFVNILKTIIIKRYYNKANANASTRFQCLLWGHSMTRLADQIISQIVKGRGSSIATEINGNLFPLRDVFLSEVDAYMITLVSLYNNKHFGNGDFIDIDDLCFGYKPKPVLINPTCINNNNEDDDDDDVNNENILKYTKEDNSKSGAVNTSFKTINQYAREYFDNIEDGYSNVISTVVRTALKLDTPSNNTVTDIKCTICQTPLYSDPTKWLHEITVNSPSPIATEEEKQLYDIWLSSQQKNNHFNTVSTNDAPGIDSRLCYGCIVTLNTLPHKEISWISESKNDTDILNEYILTDEEWEDDSE
ncbi:uncharacterized protein SCODWIG_02285 [Saccharomycodes ludwigii]|uniref:Cytoplasmic tRNA 2-thiolation protein 2 n=1 Tax=Saccharomycodes ludwigii TaxID=36035 RepID=A0A376B7P8_9ASCO|nr:uncharacterized protein SCODWIG_02285 [Saccharomycodes ludwigii]